MRRIMISDDLYRVLQSIHPDPSSAVGILNQSATMSGALYVIKTGITPELTAFIEKIPADAQEKYVEIAGATIAELCKAESTEIVHV